jgi:hypothetical protein
MKYFYHSTILIVFVSLLSCTNSNDQEKLKIKILPSNGVTIDKDTIVLGRTNIEELKEKFRLDTTLLPGVYLVGDDMTTDSIYSAIFSFKKIDFDLQSKISLDSLKLTIITVRPSDSLNVMLDSKSMNEKNIDINELFPNIKKNDIIHGLHYVLLSYGISIHFSRINDDFYISSISVFPKTNE